MILDEASSKLPTQPKIFWRFIFTFSIFESLSNKFEVRSWLLCFLGFFFLFLQLLVKLQDQERAFKLSTFLVFNIGFNIDTLLLIDMTEVCCYLWFSY